VVRTTGSGIGNDAPRPHANMGSPGRGDACVALSCIATDAGGGRRTRRPYPPVNRRRAAGAIRGSISDAGFVPFVNGLSVAAITTQIRGMQVWRLVRTATHAHGGRKAATAGRIWAMATLAIAGIAACAQEHADAQVIARACSAPEYRQFDFFVGDWDAYDVQPDTLIARNLVTPMLGGCAVREQYHQRDGHIGESFSTYDASRGVWHQSWVTNDGQLLMLEGHLEGNRMILIGPEKTKTGATRLVRGIWYPESTAVRETGERSTDGGRTWTPWFDIWFRPAGAARSRK
jgi:hypothetical protein